MKRNIVYLVGFVYLYTVYLTGFFKRIYNCILLCIAFAKIGINSAHFSLSFLPILALWRNINSLKCRSSQNHWQCAGYLQ